MNMNLNGHILNQKKYISVDDGRLEFIKWTAFLTMFIDHSANIFFEGWHELYAVWIGRFAFPVFAFLLAYRLYQKRERWVSYSNKLVLFAIISQPFYMYYFNDSPFMLNILWTLLLGVLIERGTRIHDPWPLIVIAALFLANFVEYGMIGVLIIPVIVRFLEIQDSKREYVIPVMVLFGLAGLSVAFKSNAFTAILIAPGLIGTAICFYSLIHIGPSITRKPWANFYIAYPLHIFILIMLREFIL